jgi:hypothetical protein
LVEEKEVSVVTTRQNLPAGEELKKKKWMLSGAFKIGGRKGILKNF